MPHFTSTSGQADAVDIAIMREPAKPKTDEMSIIAERWLWISTGKASGRALSRTNVLSL